MRNGYSMILLIVYLVAVAALFAAEIYEFVGQEIFYGGLMVLSALFLMVNRTWLIRPEQNS